jgi:transcription antitermination factor NusG
MNTKASDQKSWFAIYVKPRHEFKVRDELDLIKIQNYLPAVTRIKQWNDRKKKICEPLIKGYIFIFADEKERLQSVELSSVVKCLFDHGRPARIPDWQIVNLQNLLSHNGDFKVLDNLVSGSPVEIIDGPFRGVKGVIEKTESVNRLVVSIDLLNRSIVVHLPKESITSILSK